jgi:RNA-directed DNA polymerase
VKHTLHIHWYIRYMDDIIIVGHDKQELARIRDEIGAFLRRELNLALNRKTSIQPLKQGVEFVGMKVWPTHRRLRHATIRGIKLRLSQVLAEYEEGKITEESVERTIGSYRGVLSHCECMSLRHKLNQTYGKFYEIKKERGEKEHGNQDVQFEEGWEDLSGTLLSG